MAKKKAAPKRKKKPAGPEIVRGALVVVLAAFADLGKNRLGLPAVTRIYNAKKSVAEHQQESEALRLELVRQYDETGKGWGDPADAPAELVEKVGELQRELVTLDLGEPLKLTGDEDLRITEENYGILREIGFLA